MCNRVEAFVHVYRNEYQVSCEYHLRIERLLIHFLFNRLVFKHFYMNIIQSFILPAETIFHPFGEKSGIHELLWSNREYHRRYIVFR